MAEVGGTSAPGRGLEGPARSTLVFVLAAMLLLLPGGPSLVPSRPDVRVPPDREAPVELPPAAVASVHGRLLGPDDIALPGGTISAWPESDPTQRHETTTDATGAFALAGLTAERWVLAGTAGGYSEARGVRALPFDGLLELRVVRVARVAGQILGVDGLPASADVVIVGSGIWPARTVRSGTDGHFAFENVPPGVYEVEARGALASEPRRGLVVEQGARLMLTLALSAGATLAGTVVDEETGAPIAGAELVVASEALSSTPRTTRSDASGDGAIPTRTWCRRHMVYAAGSTSRVSSMHDHRPPTTGAAVLADTSAPTPDSQSSGSRPSTVVATVMTSGRTRAAAPSTTAASTSSGF